MDNHWTEFLSGVQEQHPELPAKSPQFNMSGSAPDLVLRKAEEEFEPILNFLENLAPAKDRGDREEKKFHVARRKTLRAGGDIELHISVSYDYLDQRSLSQNAAEGRPEVQLIMGVDRGRLSVRVVQCSMMEFGRPEEGRAVYVRKRVDSFDEARIELGRGIGNFARTRIGEILRLIGTITRKSAAVCQMASQAENGLSSPPAAGH